jgi:hypothetical protein
MYKFKFEQGWRRFDLSSPSRKDNNVQMCQEMEKVLFEGELFTLPKICIRKEVDKDVRYVTLKENA